MAEGFKETFKLWQVIKNLNSIFDGGSAGAALVKTTSTDFDFDWADVTEEAPSDGNYYARLNGAWSSFVPGSGGASNLIDLGDVSSSTATNRNVLVANGTDFASRALVEADISDLGTYLTAETNDLTAAVTWANVPDANITQTSVTQHVGAINHDALLNFVANEHIDWTTDQGATNIDYRNLTAFSSTQQGAAPASGGGTTNFLRADGTWAAPATAAEVNDLTAAVTWANVPDANITQSSVTQHQAALTILESQITDGSLLARLAANETVTGQWAFNDDVTLNVSGLRADAALTITGGQASIYLDGSAATTDERKWDISALDATGQGYFRLATATDADGFGATALQINRSGTSLTTWDFFGTAFDFASASITTAGNISGGTIGGITEANLLDKTATETVSGAYTFSSLASFSSGISVTGDVSGTTIGGITEANLLDKTAVETISNHWTIENASPRLWLHETGGTADEGWWRFIADADTFYLQAWNDALSLSSNVFSATRTGQTVTSVNFSSDINVTGDVGGTTIGGITEANLLDKTAAETVSGAYTFSSLATFNGGLLDTDTQIGDESQAATVIATGTMGDYNAGARRFSHLSSVVNPIADYGYMLWHGTRDTGGGYGVTFLNYDTTRFFTGYSTTTADPAWAEVLTSEANDFSSFRFYDTGRIDYAEFDHDGTDFNTTMSGTTDWNITGLTGDVSMPRIRITSTGDASATSTTHGFQVGSTTGNNIIIDNNEIMARDYSGGGIVDTLFLSADGGGVTCHNAVEGVFTNKGTTALERTSGGQILQLTDTGGAGTAANPYIGFLDSASSSVGTIGFSSASDGDLRLNPVNGNVRIADGDGSFIMPERAADLTTDAGTGRIWVLNEAPSELWFTDDNGSTHHVAGGALSEIFGTAKTADTGRSNVAVSADPHLALDCKAGFYYYVKLILKFYETAITTTHGFEWDFSIPTSATGTYVYKFWNGSGDTTPQQKFVTDYTTNQSFTSVDTAQSLLEIDGWIYTPNAGTLTLNWAQDTLDAGETTYLAEGSIMTIIEAT